MEPESNGHKLLTAEDILTADDVRSERVHVPEWGGDVIVSTLTAAQRKKWMEACYDGEGRLLPDLDVHAVTVAMTCVDGAGQPLFAPGQARALAGKSARALDRVLQAVTRLSPMGAALEAARRD